MSKDNLGSSVAVVEKTRTNLNAQDRGIVMF